MGRAIYNISILIYAFLVKLAAFFNPKARLFVKGRKGLIKKVKESFKDNNSPVAWFHCASLGEFEQARPLMEAFKEQFPSYKILLTFFSPSGYLVRKNYALADWVYYIPVDRPSKSKAFIKATRPKVAFIIKYEYWYNIIKATYDQQIPIISVSSIFRNDQLFFKSYGKLFRNLLSFFDHFFVQDRRSIKLLKRILIQNVTYSGDTRFDRVKGIRSKVKDTPIAEAFAKNSQVFVIGSCWGQDMNVLLTFINESPSLKFIIAPHTIDERFIKKLEIDLMRTTIRFSEANIDNVTEVEVLIIDNIGMLSSLYQYGDYAYIGGAFGQGLHNILEPATFGLPIFFGNKNFKKFKEARDLVNLGGAFAVGSYSELSNHFNSVSNPKHYKMASDINADYIQNNTGATDIILNYCKENLKL